jgi:hypothetical protein
MEALLTYLRETRTTPKAFAKLIGLDADRLQRILDGDEPVETAIAQRMVDATGGALLIEDLADEDGERRVVIDLRSRFAGGGDEIDAAALTDVLRVALPALLGGNRRNGDGRLPALAAEAATHTYLALSTVTTRFGADRLFQALRPVFAEILEESAAPAPLRRRLDAEVQRAVDAYFLARPQRKRA